MATISALTASRASPPQAAMADPLLPLAVGVGLLGLGADDKWKTIRARLTFVLMSIERCAAALSGRAVEALGKDEEPAESGDEPGDIDSFGL